MKLPVLEVKSIPKKGRGVFATSNIKKDAIIEICPVAVFPFIEGQQHALEGYAFRWTKTKVAIALGLGSLYNHSYTPNAEYVQDRKLKEIHVYALRNIRKGEEICFNYNGRPFDTTPVWFDAKP